MALRLLTLPVALIALGLLAACQSTSTPTPTSPFALTPTPTPAVATPTPTDEPTATPTPTATATPAPAEMLRGVSLSPLSYEADDFTAFLDRASELDVLRWAGAWTDLQSPSSAAGVVAQLSDQRDFEAVVDTGVFSADSKALFMPLTEENQAAFVEAAASFAGEQGIPYLGLGVEVNIHEEEDPESFETFVELFDRAYDAVKDQSPGTQVYVTFQLERLRGLQGGLFDGTNDPSLANWALIDRFPKSDLIGFTTYPGLIFADPADIPDDYYTEIADHTSKPIAFTELGWTSETVADGWESDEAEQAAFIERFQELTAPIEPEMAVWLWLYPQQTTLPVPFEGMTLFNADGSAKAGWAAWRGE